MKKVVRGMWCIKRWKYKNKFKKRGCPSNKKRRPEIQKNKTKQL